MERVSEAFKNNEGCTLDGYILVNKVPGNFHVSAHAFTGVLPSIMAKNNLKSLDLSHKINHLSFGDTKAVKKVKK